MPVRYDFADSDIRREELIEEISKLLTSAEKGEIYFTGFTDINLKYNMQTGEVSLSSVEQKPGIINFYSADAFQAYIALVKEAISFVAKQDLLQHLDKLQDKQISSIINAYFQSANKYNNASLDNALTKIQNLSLSLGFGIFKDKLKNDIHKVVSEALRQVGINAIFCKKQTDSIIATIDTTLMPAKRLR